VSILVLRCLKSFPNFIRFFLLFLHRIIFNFCFVCVRGNFSQLFKSFDVFFPHFLDVFLSAKLGFSFTVFSFVGHLLSEPCLNVNRLEEFICWNYCQEVLKLYNGSTCFVALLVLNLESF
jgi:hypothetical protein